MIKYRMGGVRVSSGSVTLPNMQLALDPLTGLLSGSSSKNALCFIIRHDNSQVYPPETFLVVENVAFAPFQISNLQMQHDDLILLAIPKSSNVVSLPMAKRHLYGSLFYPADLKNEFDVMNHFKSMMDGYPALRECPFLVMKVGTTYSSYILDMEPISERIFKGTQQYRCTLYFLALLLFAVFKEGLPSFEVPNVELSTEFLHNATRSTLISFMNLPVLPPFFWLCLFLASFFEIVLPLTQP